MASPMRDDQPEQGQSSPHSEDVFDTTVGSLTEGAMCFPVPFDLASSVALARNAISGDDAVDQFHLNRQEPVSYRLLVVEQVIGDPSVPGREVLNCVVQDRRAAAALLGTLAEELMDDEPRQ